MFIDCAIFRVLGDPNFGYRPCIWWFDVLYTLLSCCEGSNLVIHHLRKKGA